jgi:thioredoxin 1
MMRISRCAIFAGALLIWATSSFAADVAPFDQAQFEAAQKEGRSILVDITAPWCPTCKAQKPVIDELAARPDFKDLMIFTVDFDTQKQAVAALKASSQSTLIAFKGTRETGRSVGETQAASIEALLHSTTN